MKSYGSPSLLCENEGLPQTAFLNFPNLFRPRNREKSPRSLQEKIGRLEGYRSCRSCRSRCQQGRQERRQEGKEKMISFIHFLLKLKKIIIPN
jgi:hypothetical protein